MVCEDEEKKEKKKMRNTEMKKLMCPKFQEPMPLKISKNINIYLPKWSLSKLIFPIYQ